MKWITGVVALTLALVVTPAQAVTRPAANVDVMTQNLYIGADLSRILNGESPAAVFATVQQTNYPERAETIAETIDAAGPDLIGIQEATLITLFDSTGAVVAHLDYLAILLDQLQRHGTQYLVASSVTNADVTMPLDTTAGTTIRVVDRDVILYRPDTTVVTNPSSTNYTVNFSVRLQGFPIQFIRGFTAVDAQVGDGPTVRIVNTHLEVENTICYPRSGRPIECQLAQARELRQALSDEPDPIVLLGDFNAIPNTATYTTIQNHAFIDSWNAGAVRTDPGFTCCQNEDLRNETSLLSQRIDYVLIDDDVKSLSVNAIVLGNTPADKTPSGMWYSDHGGVFAELEFK